MAFNENVQTKIPRYVATDLKLFWFRHICDKVVKQMDNAINNTFTGFTKN